MTEQSVSASPSPKSRNPLTALLDLFSSVWFGITLMVLIFIYMTVASAGILHPLDWSQPFGTWTRRVVREQFDLTEMEAFVWWPFNLLIALFTLNMILVTVRKIRFNLLNLGVWAIHSGIVILALGSVYYFGTKLEGDTPVFRRSIVVQAPGMQAPARLVALPNNHITVPTPAGDYQFTIQGIDPNWPILSGEDAGEKGWSVNVAVETPTDSFIRQMIIANSGNEYIEDILPGQGRAVKATGSKLVDEDLSLSFSYDPQDYFFLRESGALYVREVGATDWFERPIEDLPHYRNHLAEADYEHVWLPDENQKIYPPLNLKLDDYTEGDPLDRMSVRVTGRLHYVERTEARWTANGARLNPRAEVLVDFNDASHASSQVVELFALSPANRDAANGMIGFRWATSAEEVSALARQVETRLHVVIPEAKVDTWIALDEADSVAANPEQTFTSIADSGWSYRLRGMARSGAGISSAGGVAIVEFKSGETIISRMLAGDQRPARDQRDGELVEPDPAVEASFHPAPAVLLIGGPTAEDLRLVVKSAENMQRIALNEPVSAGPGLTVTVQSLYPRAQRETRLAMTPKRLQDARVGEGASQIKVEIRPSPAAAPIVRWLPYHRYPLPSKQYASARFFYNPTRVQLPDGRQIELIFSRKRWPLPTAVALEEFQLKTHRGGFVPGNTTSVRDFVSVLRSYEDDGTWSEPFTCSLNDPAEDHGMYYFQSEWDPGSMAHTGLGVGNRNGVYIQLAGCTIAVLGMIWVFYIKPIIRRRRQERIWSAATAERVSVEAEQETVAAS